jgi:hypothetical protein
VNLAARIAVEVNFIRLLNRVLSVSFVDATSRGLLRGLGETGSKEGRATTVDLSARREPVADPVPALCCTACPLKGRTSKRSGRGIAIVDLAIHFG